MKRRKPKVTLGPIDPLFLGAFVVLVIFGLVILQSASVAQSNIAKGYTYYFFLRQLFFGVIPGIFLFYMVQRTSYKRLESLSIIFFLIALILNVLVALPNIGTEVYGATRWINLGLFSFQPSELLKLGTILYLSMILSKNRQHINSLSFISIYFLIIIAINGILIIWQSNLSTALLITSISLMLLFNSPAKLRWISGFISIIILIGVLGIALSPYRLQRFTTFLNPEQDKFNTGYHIQQNLIAIGSGGLLGVGLGQSRQKFSYIPEVNGDSIFAVLGEELGLVGICFLLSTILIIFFRSIYIAFSTQDMFARLTIIGIMSWFAFQTFLNIGANISIIPLTGTTLPFVSYGSTSLWALFIAFGIIANISRHNSLS